MARVTIPTYVAIIKGVRCEVSASIREHYRAAGDRGAPVFEQTGFIEVDESDVRVPRKTVPANQTWERV